MRLPSFNDFSPGLIPDLRGILGTILPIKPIGDILDEVGTLAPRLTNLQRRKNVIITLGNLGLATRTDDEVVLTLEGETVRDAVSQEAAALAMCRHIILHRNGLALLRAVDALDRSGVPLTKRTLQHQLELDGVTHLSNATTDHTTLANWMGVAGLLEEKDKTLVLSDTGMKAGLGFGLAGLEAMETLSEQQRVYVLELKRRSLVMATGEYVQAGAIFDACADVRPALFDNQDQMRAAVTAPLEAAGWIEFKATPSTATGRGGKGGWIRPGKTLDAVPVEDLLPQYLDAIPADLRAKLQTPAHDVQAMLNSASDNDRGLGLELLALRMVVDLGLRPVGFRLRAEDTTGGTEVDLVAEGRHLAFTRWTIQCKHMRESVNVSQMAKEVGIATHLRSHVVVMVSKSGFSRPALSFAAGVTRNTPLQFVMIGGPDLDRYLESGADWLARHVGRWVERTAEMKSLRPGDKAPADDD